MVEKSKLLIGGEWVEGSESFTVTSPFSGEALAEVSSADGDQLHEAIVSSQEGATQMRKQARFQVAGGLRRIADGINNRKAEFAQTIAKEAAKPIKLARGEVERAISTFSWAAGEAERFTGEVVPMDTQPTGKAKIGYTRREPRGVIYGITPFNFPLNLIAHKVAPALAAGNSIIIKPSQRTPLTSLLLGEVFLVSGLPKAALQVVPMDIKFMGDVLNDDRIAMISFTGSAAVGWDLKQRSGRKAIALELGGNAPVIVDESANMETSVSKVITGSFAYAGQVCISVQRVFVHERHFDEWTGRFVEEAKLLKTGDPLNQDTQLSVMIDEDAASRAESWITEAVDNGATVLCGGKCNGAMLDATVLTNTSPEMRVISEEVFAPVVAIESFSKFEEAVENANIGKYGLQCGVFTGDLKNANYAAEALQYGGVIINDVPTFRVDNMPYGGMKESGFGREGVRYAMEEMSELKLVVITA
jgi:acyl-CoA reductase-like NAD-dependent aldehyde dehydrogenase